MASPANLQLNLRNINSKLMSQEKEKEKLKAEVPEQSSGFDSEDEKVMTQGIDESCPHFYRNIDLLESKGDVTEEERYTSPI